MSPGNWKVEELPKSLLVIAPHPDDEVLGCGRLMRRVTAAGGRVVVAWMTDGGGSHGELDAEARRILVARRRGEALDGLAAMGLAPVETCFLGYRDGALALAQLDEPLRRLQDLCDTHRIDTAAVTDAGDGHADHRAAFGIAHRLRVARLFAYPISTRYDGEPYAPPPSALLIPPDASDDKRTALSRHTSQSASEGARFPLSEATIARFCAEPEIFIPVGRVAS